MTKGTRGVAVAVVVVAGLAAVRCGREPMMPSPTPSAAAPSDSIAQQPRVIVTPTTPVTIAFGGLTTNNAAVTTYAESGFTVKVTASSWIAWTGYGHPAPAIVFMSNAGNSGVGQIDIDGPAGFAFRSVDLYSSTTTIPYAITGTSSGVTAFALSGELPHTFGNFATVSNPNLSTVVDKLTIKLTNAAAPCCQNPMGVDNIALVK